MTTAQTTSNAGNDTVRFLRVGDPGQEVPVIQDRSGWAYNLSPVVGTGDLDGSFFASGGVGLAMQALDSGRAGTALHRGVEGRATRGPTDRGDLHRAELCGPCRRNRRGGA